MFGSPSVFCSLITSALLFSSELPSVVLRCSLMFSASSCPQASWFLMTSQRFLLAVTTDSVQSNTSRTQTRSPPSRPAHSTTTVTSVNTHTPIINNQQCIPPLRSYFTHMLTIKQLISFTLISDLVCHQTFWFFPGGLKNLTDLWRGPRLLQPLAAVWIFSARLRSCGRNCQSVETQLSSSEDAVRIMYLHWVYVCVFTRLLCDSRRLERWWKGR